jgi:signal transduction histidine kinase
MKNNLFWLLFGSTAIGLSICGLALYFSILFAMEQDQVLDFSDDVQVLRSEIETSCRSAKENLALETCITEHHETYSFIVRLTQELPIIESEKIAAVGDKQIYYYFDNDNQEEGFLAVMPLKMERLSERFWLIIRDDFAQHEVTNELVNNTWSIEDNENEGGNDDLDIALTGAIYGTVILLFSLALFLYMPVRKLNRWLSDMQYASEQIGKQNYDVRLTEYKTQPLVNIAFSFNGMAEKIQNHIRDKNILANAIAHELRTPLTRFRLALGLLHRQPLEGLAKELVHDLERYTDELELITDNTLRLATLRDSDVNLQIIKLNELINNEGEKFSASFPKLIVSVSSQDCQLNTDIGFLQLALDNLLSNACHYADSTVNLIQWPTFPSVDWSVASSVMSLSNTQVAQTYQWMRTQTSDSMKTKGKLFWEQPTPCGDSPYNVIKCSRKAEAITIAPANCMVFLATTQQIEFVHIMTDSKSGGRSGFQK